MSQPKILIVDDELSMRELLSILFEKDGYLVKVAGSSEEAQQILPSFHPNVVLSDLNLPKDSGIDLLRWVKKHQKRTAFVVITAFGSTQSAVEAMKLGAANYVLKPFNNDELRLVVSRAIGVKSLELENANLKEQLGKNKNFGFLIGSSPVMQEVYELIKRVKDSRINCLLMGESGTGKELVARAIHYSGLRSEHPFVTINCGAIPENLVESELFGHKKGAFTNAFRDKLGLLAVANKGTVFLDEVDSLPLTAQVKLLRAIQERKIISVGAIQEVDVDIRVIAATNGDIERNVKEGLFREDLYYRLNVVEIVIPPLRERGNDIEELVLHFVEKFSREYNKRIIGLSPEALWNVRSWRYPGNVRELQNVIERAVALCPGNVIQVEDLPDVVSKYTDFEDLEVPEDFPEEGIELDELLATIEKKWLLASLRATSGKKTAAAELLKVSFRSFRYRLIKHNLDV
jgi:two-component system, NtrC family, response regulator PilR